MRASLVWWILCVITAVLGGSAGGVGLWIEVSKQDATGLYCLILAPFLLAASGIFATLAAKFESESR